MSGISLIEKMTNRVILTPAECVEVAEFVRDLQAKLGAIERGYFAEMKRAHQYENIVSELAELRGHRALFGLPEEVEALIRRAFDVMRHHEAA